MTREEAKNSIDEIDFLTWQIDIINNTIDQIFDEHEAQLKAKDKKARSIVAMLFWEAKRYKRLSIFKQAYKMLKDTK